MLNRRRFMAVPVLAAVAATLPVQTFAATPLRATPKHRRIFPKREEDGSWLLHSDAPYEPRKVIRPDVIERVFGDGAFNRLSQRDHWAMIEAGDLGYCEIFDFKCASSRTCSAWVVDEGGIEEIKRLMVKKPEALAKQQAVKEATVAVKGDLELNALQPLAQVQLDNQRDYQAQSQTESSWWQADLWHELLSDICTCCHMVRNKIHDFPSDLPGMGNAADRLCTSICPSTNQM